MNRACTVMAAVGAGALLMSAAYASEGGHRASRVNASARSSDSTDMANSFYKRCARAIGDAKEACYTKPLDSLASLGEVKTAMRLLKALGARDAAVKRDGHIFAHQIGIAAAEAGGDISTTFAKCDESNQSGCYHGVIQAYFAAAPKVGPAEVNSLCEPFHGPNADQWIRFQCVHGMGHGLEMVYDHNLPKALSGCDLLKDTWDQDSCYGGAFMENIVNVTSPMHPGHGMKMHMAADTNGAPPFKAIDPKDPLYPCSALGHKYQEACYEMQTSVILYLNNGDIAATARTCDTAPFAMRFVCYQSLGRDISSYSLQDHAIARRMCSLGTARYQPWCYFGLVKNFIDLEARPGDGIAFCKVLPGDFNKVKCYQAVGEEVATLRNDRASRRAMCSESEPNYLDACLFGAGLVAEAPISLARLNASALDSARR